MSKRLSTSQRPFEILVNGIVSPSLSNGVPSTRVRNGFRYQFLQMVGARSSVSSYSGVDKSVLATNDPFGNRASGEIEVVDNDFSYPMTLTVGIYTLTSGVDFAIGGGPGATATNLAAAITALPGYEAVAAGALVTVQAPPGSFADELILKDRYEGIVRNLEITPDDGRMILGLGSPVGPPEIF